MRNAAEEYHAEFAAKEATIAALSAEADAGRARMQAEIEKLRRDMEARACPTLTLNPLPCRPKSRSCGATWRRARASP